jgi:signal peptidase I
MEVQVSVTNNKKTGQKKPWPARLAVLIGNTVFALALLIMCVLVFSMVKSKFVGGPPSVGGYQMYIVLSGSMGPAFEAGSMVFVRPAEPGTIESGDIITYKGTESNALTTHRVVEVLNEGGLKYITKGDANDINDGTPVPAGNVVGRVHYSAPYVGYLMSFAQTKKGLILLVFAPGLLIILFELKNLFRLAEAMEAEKKAKARQSADSVDVQS